MAPLRLPRILIGIALLVCACGGGDAEPPIPQIDDDCPLSAPIPVFDKTEQLWFCAEDCRDGFIFQNGECLALID